jgi:hypothetical protein
MGQGDGTFASIAGGYLPIVTKRVSFHTVSSLFCFKLRRLAALWQKQFRQVPLPATCPAIM